jgi:hypothetical protein
MQREVDVEGQGKIREVILRMSNLVTFAYCVETSIHPVASTL